MQDTSNIQNYDQIVGAGDYSEETKITINGVDYGEEDIKPPRTYLSLFGGGNPTIGKAVVGEIDVEMKHPVENIPRAAEVRVYSRVFNSSLTSGWVAGGVYYISTREKNEKGNTLSFHGFDAMLRAEVKYPSSELEWSATSPKPYQVLNEISEYLDIELDERTTAVIRDNVDYVIPFPAQYTLREVLGSIAAMYSGSFIISPLGKLQLVRFGVMPDESYYIITEGGNAITFGGIRILRREVS